MIHILQFHLSIRSEYVSHRIDILSNYNYTHLDVRESRDFRDRRSIRCCEVTRVWPGRLVNANFAVVSVCFIPLRSPLSSLSLYIAKRFTLISCAVAPDGARNATLLACSPSSFRFRRVLKHSGCLHS